MIILYIICLYIHACITYMGILIILINKYNIHNASYFYILLGCNENETLDIMGNPHTVKIGIKTDFSFKSL
jgi:hypothetical protein